VIAFDQPVTLRGWAALPRGVATVPEAVREISGAPYDALVIDDRALGAATEELQRALGVARSARPRVIRLQSFVALTAQDQQTPIPCDVELTKPLRLRQLHRALGDCAYHGIATLVGLDAAGPVARHFAPLAGRVLVVEDQPLNREVAIGMLASLGLAVETAEHGQAAIDRLQTQRFDAILMDCEMPVMDGFSATAALRRREAPGSHLPIIALTADATGAGRADCLEAGMDDYLAKPFRRDALHAMLTRWLPAGASAGADAAGMAAAVAREPTLDTATLAALRALPRRGSTDMLRHIGEMYLSDSRARVAAIEQALEAGDATELARAAHAWRSYNGNVGATGLAGLCREIEECARRGDLSVAREVYLRIGALHERVRDELQSEMRKSA